MTTTWPPPGYTTPTRAAQALGISRQRLYTLMASDPPRDSLATDYGRLVSLADVARWQARERNRGGRPRKPTA